MALEDFRIAHNHQPSTTASQIVQKCSSWTAPMDGWLKTNWDVAISKENGRVGMGVVIRTGMESW
jgi:hypothetical protein